MGTEAASNGRRRARRVDDAMPRCATVPEMHRFRGLVEYSSDVIALLDLRGRIRYVSPAITRLTGHEVGECMGRPALGFLDSADAARCRDGFQGVVREAGSVSRLEFSIRHRDGSLLTMEAVATSRLEDPAVGAVVVNLRDMTERKRIEAELRFSQELLQRRDGQYHALMEQAEDAIIVCDPRGRIIDANTAACHLTAYARAELLRMSIAETYAPEDRAGAMRRFHMLPKGGRAHAERQLRRKDGSERTVEIRIGRLLDGRVQGILRDVTDRKAAEAHLRWLTLAIEQTPAAVIMTDVEGVIEYVNPGFTAMTGYTPADVIGKTPRVVRSGLTRPQEHEELWRTIKAGGVWRGELCNRRKDGQLYWHSASVAPIRGSSGRIEHFMAIQQDITDRREAEASLRERESRLRRVIESNLLGIGFWQRSGVVTEANDEFLRIVGCDLTGIEAGDIDLRRMTAPEYADADARAFEQVRTGMAVAPWEKELVRCDGARIPVLMGIAPLDDRREHGVAFLLDITARRALQCQLQQAQKMEAVGRLAGGVAHDFNNILTAITGYSDLLREDLTPGHPCHADVVEIRIAADRAAGLTRQLLAFSRQQQLETRVLDLNDLIRNLEKMLRRLLGEDIDLRTVLHPSLGAVRADPGQIEQVILNLAVNSRDAMPDGGRLTIETSIRDIAEGHVEGFVPMKAGRYVTVAVQDVGVGMDAATRARLFEPFFTTKEQGKGTGLGLSTVYGIVKQSDGYITVRSAPGTGSTFTMLLPLVDEPTEELADDAPAVAPRRGTETVLLAEDDPGVREIVRETLTRAGYRVLAAENGTEALRLAGRSDAPVRLLITDVVMPQINGPTLYARLRADQPGLRVLFMSGYTDDTVLRRGIIEHGSPYLQKPFSPELLLLRVRAILDAGE